MGTAGEHWLPAFPSLLPSPRIFIERSSEGVVCQTDPGITVSRGYTWAWETVTNNISRPRDTYYHLNGRKCVVLGIEPNRNACPLGANISAEETVSRNTVLNHTLSPMALKFIQKEATGRRAGHGRSTLDRDRKSAMTAVPRNSADAHIENIGAVGDRARRSTWLPSSLGSRRMDEGSFV